MKFKFKKNRQKMEKKQGVPLALFSIFGPNFFGRIFKLLRFKFIEK